MMLVWNIIEIVGRLTMYGFREDFTFRFQLTFIFVHGASGKAAAFHEFLFQVFGTDGGAIINVNPDVARA